MEARFTREASGVHKGGGRAVPALRLPGQGQVELPARVDVELLEHCSQVVVDRVGAEEQPGCDLLVGHPFAGRTRAGGGYAAIWAAVIGGRILFAYEAQYWFVNPVTTFSRDHAITGARAWTAALVLLSLAMVLGRVAVTAVSAELAQSSHPGGHVSHAGAWS